MCVDMILLANSTFFFFSTLHSEIQTSPTVTPTLPYTFSTIYCWDCKTINLYLVFVYILLLLKHRFLCLHSYACAYRDFLCVVQQIQLVYTMIINVIIYLLSIVWFLSHHLSKVPKGDRDCPRLYQVTGYRPSESCKKKKKTAVKQTLLLCRETGRTRKKLGNKIHLHTLNWVTWLYDGSPTPWKNNTAGTAGKKKTHSLAHLDPSYNTNFDS